MQSSIERARAAFEAQAWDEAYAGFVAVAAEERLAVDDAEQLAVAAYLVGEDVACERAWEAAHRAGVDAGDLAGAARCACWLALVLMMQGQMAKANGWLARADRLIEEAGVCPAAGYRLIPALLGALGGGDAAAARDLAVRATEIGERFDDADLRAFGVLGLGQALLAMGDPLAGTARLDEVMVSVTGGEVGPVTTGVVYCAVILECMTSFDLARATEWTAALGSWCEAQPSLVPYRGQCLVHRSQVQQAAGDWRTASATVAAACRRLTDPPHPALGLAHYQAGDLHRLAGRLDDAGTAYRLASRLGHHPMPGVALLELARDEAAAAAVTIRRALEEGGDARERPALLGAAVDILRAAGDTPGARVAADELLEAASSSSAPLLTSMAAHALGTVLVAEGDPVAAIPPLRRAAAGFAALHMPYEAARTAVVTGLARAALGDHATADMQLDNAAAVFADLGAGPDLARVLALRGRPGPGAGAGLSRREREVLDLVVAGRTNRQIAEALVISPHTVRRHLENIFAKLGVNTRAAATAYAYEHGLVHRS